LGGLAQKAIQYLSIAGSIASIIGLVGLLIAIIQLHRTKKAAKAAEDSAKQTVERISGIVSVASIEQICNRSRQLLHMMRNKDLSGSATAALELRESLAKFSTSKAATQIQKGSTWQPLLSTVSEIHDSIEAAALIRRIDSDFREELIRRIANVHSELSKLTGVVGDRAGGI